MRPIWKSVILPMLVLLGFTTSACAQPVPAAPGLKRGLNIENWRPNWRQFDAKRLPVSFFRKIRQSGFDFVRIQVYGIQVTRDDGSIDPTWLRTFDQVLGNAKAAGLSVVIDEHNFQFCRANGPECARKLPLFWGTLAARYRNQPKTVFFELLNEPNGQMNDIWNATLAKTIAAVRRSNPTRTLIVGPSHSNAFEHLQELQLPADDRNLLVTFHYYQPNAFTHQGAEWNPSLKEVSGNRWGSEQERIALNADFAKVARWAGANRRPILLGEFGAYYGYKRNNPLDQRRQYTTAVVQAAEKQGFAWAYWPFSGINDYNGDWDNYVRPVLGSLMNRAN